MFYRGWRQRAKFGPKGARKTENDVTSRFPDPEFCLGYSLTICLAVTVEKLLEVTDLAWNLAPGGKNGFFRDFWPLNMIWHESDPQNKSGGLFEVLIVTIGRLICHCSDRSHIDILLLLMLPATVSSAMYRDRWQMQGKDGGIVYVRRRWALRIRWNIIHRTRKVFDTLLMRWSFATCS